MRARNAPANKPFLSKFSIAPPSGGAEQEEMCMRAHMREISFNPAICGR